MFAEEPNPVTRYTLDARRLLCPLPVIRTQDRVQALQAGDELEVVSTDPGAAKDIPAWCRVNGHKVLEVDEKNGEVIVVLRVDGGAA